MEECCGTCKYFQCYEGEWYCMNENADNFGIETDYKDDCQDWKEADQ